MQQRPTAVDQIGVSRGWTRRPSRAEQSEAGAAVGRGLENRWPVVRDLDGRDLRGDGVHQDAVVDPHRASRRGACRGSPLLHGSGTEFQGHIWRTGFERKELQGVVFKDVLEALKNWQSHRMKVCMYLVKLF